jgi:hypothetical protein
MQGWTWTRQREDQVVNASSKDKELKTLEDMQEVQDIK